MSHGLCDSLDPVEILVGQLVSEGKSKTDLSEGNDTRKKELRKPVKTSRVPADVWSGI